MGRADPSPIRFSSVSGRARSQTTSWSGLFNSTRLRSSITAPPPTDNTQAPEAARKEGSRRASRSRKAASPRVANRSSIETPSSSSIHVSTSKKGRCRRSASSSPTDVLPAPIIPTSTMWPSGERAEVAITVAHELVEGIAAELAQGLARQHEGHHGLGYHAHGRDGGDVGALLEGKR